MPLPKLIAVVGPTASGKSDLAVQLAKKFNGEVVSADSRQVYTGLDIGTGKITKKEMQGVPHHLLDVISPKKEFSVSEYKKLAEVSIEDILQRGKLPILCGGTGFYIDTVALGQTFPEVPPNMKLRKKLEKKTAEELFEILKKLDHTRAETIDQHNKVRLIRAIEIATALGKVPEIKTTPKYETLFIGIEWPQEKLQERIHTRLLSRIKTGMIREVQKLHTQGLSWKKMFALGLEYRYISLFLQKKISKEEMLETLEKEICHYAKRQMTWFKRNKNINWLSPKQLSHANKQVRLFIKK